MGFRFWGLGLGVRDLGFGVEDLGFWVCSLGLRVEADMMAKKGRSRATCAV